MSRKVHPSLLATAVGAVVLLSAVAALMLSDGPQPSDHARPQVAAPDPVPVSPAVVEVVEPSPVAEPERTSQVQEPPPEAPERGTVMVLLTGRAPDDTTVVEVVASDWRLHAGAAHAVRARAEIAAGADRTELRLPSGAFSLLARAPGWTSAARRVDLDVRTPHALVELGLEACATLHGVLVQHDGQPAPDLGVHLEDAEGQWLASSRSGHDGGYVLSCVPAGSARLVVGALAGPLVEPAQIEVTAPSSRLPDVVLPPMGRIEIDVRDAWGAPVPDLALEAQSDSRVRLELHSDLLGTARSAYVPAGLWRAFADAGALGRGNVAFEVGLDEPVRAELRLRR